MIKHRPLTEFLRAKSKMRKHKPDHVSYLPRVMKLVNVDCFCHPLQHSRGSVSSPAREAADTRDQMDLNQITGDTRASY